MSEITRRDCEAADAAIREAGVIVGKAFDAPLVFARAIATAREQGQQERDDMWRRWLAGGCKPSEVPPTTRSKTMTLLERLRTLTARIGDAGNVGVIMTVDPRPTTLPESAVRANILYTNGIVDETCAGPDVASVLAQVDGKLTAQGL